MKNTSEKTVLVIGWEFPPRMVGGLAIATFGIVEAMSQFMKVLLIIPYKDEQTPTIPNVTIYGVNNLELDFEEVQFNEIERNQQTKQTQRTQYTERVQRLQRIKEILNKKTTIVSSFKEIHSYPLAFEEGIESLESIKSLESYELVESKGLVETLELTESEEIEIVTEAQPKSFRSYLEIFNSTEMYGKGLWEKLPVFAEIVNEVAGLLEFDMVHCHDWVTFSAGKKIKATYDKPLCLHVHALETDRTFKTIKNDIYEIEQSAMQMADLIFPVSAYTKEQIVEHYGINGDKITPIYNAIDEKLIKRWKHKIPQRIVTFLGRITAQKGPEYLFETAQKVVAKFPDVRFVIAGTGDQMAQLIAASADNKISRHFIFTGFISRDNADALLATSDVYFMPSVSEPFGLTALEATRAGVPCVLSKQSGAAEVLTSALSADYWNTDLFADHIVKLLQDEDFRQSVINANKEEMSKISWYASAALIVKKYAEIL